MGKRVFSEIRGQYKNADWNKAYLTEALDADMDYDVEFKELSAKYLEEKRVFSEIRGQYKNADWNKAYLTEALDADMDYDVEFKELSAKFVQSQSCTLVN